MIFYYQWTRLGASELVSGGRLEFELINSEKTYNAMELITATNVS